MEIYRQIVATFRMTFEINEELNDMHPNLV